MPRFQRGASGNPSGKPKGAVHKITRLARKLGEPAAPEIFKSIIERAKAGDPFAQRAYLQYFVPLPRFNPTPIEAEPPENATVARQQIGALYAQAAAGQLDLDAARALVAILQAWLGEKAVEHEEAARRQRELEEEAQQRGGEE